MAVQQKQKIKNILSHKKIKEERHKQIVPKTHK
jgi:hypothetical protein